MKLNMWLFKTSLKYLFTKKSAFSIILISIIGITLGVAVLILVLSIMNGSQMIFYENSQEVLSYHIQITGSSDFIDVYQFTNRLRQENQDIFSANIFFESQGLLMNSGGKQIFALLRGVEPDILELDTRMASYITALHNGHLKSGSFDLTDEDGIILGSNLARSLSVTTGSKVEFYSLSGGAVDDEEDLHTNFKVKGAYETLWNAGVDGILAFIPLSAYPLVGNGVPYKIGIKLHNSKLDHRVLSDIKTMGLSEGWEISSWRDYNRSFFAALRLEKTVMMLLVFLIFIVFAVNTYNGLNRLIHEKQEELGILRTMGATPFHVRSIFILQGFFIALIGAFWGTVIGLLITFNLQEVRDLFDAIKTWFLSKTDPDYFNYYQWDNSSFSEPRILLKDLLLINFMAFAISLFAAYLASIKIGKIKPAEVLRNE